MTTELKFHEKRSLEKLMFADIDKVSADYKANRAEDRTALVARLTHQSSVQKLFQRYLAGRKEMADAEKALERIGYDIYGYSEPHHVIVKDSKKIPELAGFDFETNARTHKLAEMKRTYTLKLFAGGEEAKELFASLAKELAAIVKQN